MARKTKIKKVETEDFVFPKRDETKSSEVASLSADDILTLLTNKGFKPGKDLNDRATKTAIKFFQKTNGLKITSDLNDETLVKLKD